MTTPMATDIVEHEIDDRERALLERLLEALKDDVALDLVYDDIDVALGESPPTPQEVATFTPRLRRALPQLVEVLLKRRNRQPSNDEAQALDRADRALAESVPTDDSARARGHLQQLAGAAQGILDILVEDAQ